MIRLKWVSVLHLGDGYGTVEEGASFRGGIPCFIHRLEYVDATAPLTTGFRIRAKFAKAYVCSRRTRCHL